MRIDEIVVENRILGDMSIIGAVLRQALGGAARPCTQNDSMDLATGLACKLRCLGGGLERRALRLAILVFHVNQYMLWHLCPFPSPAR